MKHISNLLNESFENVSQDEPKMNTNGDIDTVVNQLFVFFYYSCPGFRKQCDEDKEGLGIIKKLWKKGFFDEGLNSVQKIDRGISRCLKEGQPNIPTIGQFIKWCNQTPEDLGIPSVEHAYDEAVRNSHFTATKKWTHDAIYHAWTMCNKFELSSLPKKTTFPIFERYYDITVKKILRGEPITKIPVAIPEKVVTAEDLAHKEEKAKAANEDAMLTIRKMLGGKK